jgi:hypothetical protein
MAGFGLDFALQRKFVKDGSEGNLEMDHPMAREGSDCIFSAIVPRRFWRVAIRLSRVLTTNQDLLEERLPPYV